MDYKVRAFIDKYLNENFGVIGGSKLTVGFGKGNFRLADGTIRSFPGGAIIVPDNMQSEIMVDLQDLSLHAFPRALHRGAVHIATVTSSNGVVTSIQQPANFVVPAGRIEKVKRKLARNNQIVKIALIGDSLTEGAGIAPFWPDLIFNLANAVSGYNIHGLSHAVVDNFAVGGQTSHYGAAVLGQAVSSDGAGALYGSTGITYGQSYGTRYFNPPLNLPKSPLLTNQYDLAFVAFGANGGTNNLGYLESIVKELRRRGTEVILGSQNGRTDPITHMYNETAIIAQMADAWGCEFVDTWSYVREAEINGINCHADVVHMNAAGHVQWAKALRSVINDYVQPREVVDVTNVQRIITETDSNMATKFPNSVDIQFTPFAHTGTVIAGTNDNASKNLALLFGGKTAANYITQLTTGQSASFAHSSAHALDFLVQADTTFTADITTNNGGQTLATISATSLGFARVTLVEGVKIGDYGTLVNTLTGYMNRGLQLVVTSGTCNLVGAVFHTWHKREIQFKEIEFVGTWADDTWVYAHPFSKYSDTNGDYFIFEFEGTGCQILLSQRSAGCIIDIWFDGVLVRNQTDLYVVGLYAYTFDLFAMGAQNHFDRGYGRHTVKVRANGVNAAAVAPAAGNHRLQLLAAYAMDGR